MVQRRRPRARIGVDRRRRRRRRPRPSLPRGTNAPPGPGDAPGRGGAAGGARCVADHGRTRCHGAPVHAHQGSVSRRPRLVARLPAGPHLRGATAAARGNRLVRPGERVQLAHGGDGAVLGRSVAGSGAKPSPRRLVGTGGDHGPGGDWPGRVQRIEGCVGGPPDRRRRSSCSAPGDRDCSPARDAGCSCCCRWSDSPRSWRGDSFPRASAPSGAFSSVGSTSSALAA